MPATATAPAASSSIRPSGQTAASPTAAAERRRCPYCCTVSAREAKKCYACGEWIVRTSAGVAAATLRLLGVLWVGLTVLAAVALWGAGRAAKLWVLLRAVDPIITPLAFDLALYALLAVLLLQGLTVGVGLAVLARLAPRRPRWWS